MADFKRVNYGLIAGIAFSLAVLLGVSYALAVDVDVTPKIRPSTTQLITDQLNLNTINNTFTLQINEADAGGKSICRFADVSGNLSELIGADKVFETASMSKLRLLARDKLILQADTDIDLKLKLIEFGLMEEEE